MISVGLKTTSGRLSLDGVVPLAAAFDTVGPIVKTVEDAALTFAILDDSPVPDLRNATLEGVRFLVLENVVFDDIRDAPRQGFEQAVEVLARAGRKSTAPQFLVSLMRWTSPRSCLLPRPMPSGAR